jgi:hypothetical protein
MTQKTKQPQDIIEKICYLSSNQSISYREIYKAQDKKIKIIIKSDSYHCQCFARAYVLRNDEWIELYSIPYSLMTTPEGLAYKENYKTRPAVAEGNFRGDIQQLKYYIEQILF